MSNVHPIGCLLKIYKNIQLVTTTLALADWTPQTFTTNVFNEIKKILRIQFSLLAQAFRLNHGNFLHYGGTLCVNDFSSCYGNIFSLSDLALGLLVSLALNHYSFRYAQESFAVDLSSDRRGALVVSTTYQSPLLSVRLNLLTYRGTWAAINTIDVHHILSI